VPDTTPAGIEDPGVQQRPARGPGRRTVLVLSTVLAVVLVAAAGVAFWLLAKDRAADERREARAQATAVASQFALRMDKVDGKDFDGYIKRINELLTTKAQAKNNETFKVLEQTYQAAKVTGSGKVLMTAVGDSDDDSATVLVVHDSEVTTTQGKVEHHYRWTVELVKVKGEWRVDDYNPVN
jgi:hypothetical protein